jgi:uncharacterized RDD family membrane protein YckC
MPTTAFDTRAEIETPENVILTFHIAGPGSRIGAFLADLCIRIVIGYALVFCMGAAFPVLGQALSTGAFLIGLFLLEWGYGALFEGLNRGQTPGKKIFKLRVIKDAGYPISFYDATLRNFVRAADFLPFGYGSGLLCMTATKRMQRIGDLVAGTIVIHDERLRFERNTSAFHDLEPLHPAERSRRFFVSERTLDVIEQLLWRRHKLPRRRVEEIAGILAEPLARQLGHRLDDDLVIDRDLYFLKRVLRTFSTLDKGQSS